MTEPRARWLRCSEGIRHRVLSARFSGTRSATLSGALEPRLDGARRPHQRRFMPTRTARGIFAALAVAAAALSVKAQQSDGGASGAVVFENARVIVGDGSAPIESARLVVEGGRIVAVGPADDVDAPQGADVVDLGGLIVMPALVDTHTHLSRTRDELIEDLRQRARFGVGAAASLGQDEELAFEIRDEDIPGAARFYTAGRGITTPEPGRSDIPYWITTADEGRAAVRELAERDVDIVKIWVDDRNGEY